MAKKFQLSIPEPCHENWDAMTPVEKGKFCGSCQKQVVDFSTMSDRQVAEFFKKPSTGSVCGRFMTDQLERDIEIPRKRIPWFKYFFQFALPAFLVSIKASSVKAQGEIRVRTTATDTTKKPIPIRMGMVAKPICTKPVIGDTIVFSNVNRTIFGVVTDEKGDPVPGPTIVIKGTRTGVSADNNGNFRILAKTGDILVATSSSHQATEITVGASKAVSISMRSLIISGTEVVVMAGGISVLYDPPKKIKPKKEIVEEVITGKITIKKGGPVPGVTVIIKGTKTAVVSNVKGEFSTRAKKNDVLQFYSAGFEMKEIIIEDKKNINVRLVPIIFHCDLLTTKKKKELNNLPLIQEIKNREVPAFKIFPNPVEAGSDLNIELKKTEEGYHTIELLNQSGQPVHQQEVWINADAKQLSITIPETTAGNYFIVLTNKQTGKKLTEKIIIQ